MNDAALLADLRAAMRGDALPPVQRASLRDVAAPVAKVQGHRNAHDPVTWPEFIRQHRKDVEAVQKQADAGQVPASNVRPHWPDDWVAQGCHPFDAKRLRNLWSTVFFANLLDAVKEARRGRGTPPWQPPWINSQGMIEVAELAGFSGIAVAGRIRASFATAEGIEALYQGLKKAASGAPEKEDPQNGK